MSTLEEYTLVIGCFQGCLLFVLLSLDARLSTASRVLGLLCLVMASAFFMPFLRATEDGPLLPLAGWLFYIPASAGALAYLYCRSALLDTRLRARDGFLLLPWIACYALVLDIVLGKPNEMLHWINGAAPFTWRLQASEYLLFAQAFAYAGLTVRMIWRYRRDANAALADFNPDVFRWMLVLQVLTIAIWSFNALPALTAAPYAFAQGANLLMVVMVYLIAFAQWRHPHLFTIPQLSAEQAEATRRPASVSEDTDGELDATLRARLYDEIRATVEGRQLYLDNQLTLSTLADATGFSRHQVSEALNRHGGKNFYEFINEYRIAAVCDRFARDRDATILDIAMDAGFSSKSTFNAIFKQFTGVTPTHYRRHLADPAHPADGGASRR